MYPIYLIELYLYGIAVKIIIVFVSSIISSISIYAQEPLIISGHPNYPPITWKENEKIVGVAAELAKTIFNELNIFYKIKASGPWKRVQQNAKDGYIDVITSVYTNKEREEYMNYTIPFMTDPSVIFVLKEKSFPFTEWNDLMGKHGTTTLGESYGEEFDRFMEKNLKIDRVKTHLQNFKKLEKGRVDYMLFTLYPGRALAAKAGYDEKIEILPQIVYQANFYMAFSKKSKFKHLIPQINKIIKRLKSEGAIEKWFLKYEDYYQKTQG